jgi:hypothetical protein
MHFICQGVHPEPEWAAVEVRFAERASLRGQCAVDERDARDAALPHDPSGRRGARLKMDRLSMIGHVEHRGAMLRRDSLATIDHVDMCVGS